MKRKEKDLTVIFLLFILFSIIIWNGYQRYRINKENIEKICGKISLDFQKRIILKSAKCSQLARAGKSAYSEKLSQFTFSPVNINTASFEKLITIRGVGKHTARQICNLRKKRAIRSIEEFAQIAGIGKKRARKLEKYFVFADTN